MRARVLWAVLALVLVIVAFSTSSSIPYRMLFGVLAVPLFGYVGTVLSARRLEGGVRRTTPFLQVGDTLEEQFTLRNRHWWPKLLVESEHNTGLFAPSGRVVTLWPYGSLSWTASKHCDRRGVYRFGVLEVTSRDPLGLFSRSIRVGTAQTALIYPATVELPGFFVPS